MRKVLSGWGLYPIVEAELYYMRNVKKLKEMMMEKDSIIARGLGRSYGDSSIGKNVIDFSKFNYFLGFDPENNILKITSGVSLEEILEFATSKGYFLKITPGTKFVTVGGAIASNVHGKNHHKEGSFVNSVRSFRLMLANGEVLNCSRNENSDLFWYSFGGMGLLGVILDVELELKKINSVNIDYVGIKARDLEEVFTLFEENHNYTYSVAWIDCLKRGKHLGRSILMLGEHSDDGNLVESKNKSFSVPFFLPSFVLNKLSIKAFNALYYSKQLKNRVVKKIDYNSFFYPLDSILNWNKMYGKRGFFQYQFVIPQKDGFSGLKEILEKISKSGYGSFLAVLKLFGKENAPFSFPMEGYTLALDFPVLEETLQLARKLDKIVMKYGGRLYLSKDSRMEKKMFIEGYKEALEKFLEIKNRYDPEGKFQSHQWKRLSE